MDMIEEIEKIAIFVLSHIDNTKSSHPVITFPGKTQRQKMLDALSPAQINYLVSQLEDDQKWVVYMAAGPDFPEKLTSDMCYALSGLAAAFDGMLRHNWGGYDLVGIPPESTLIMLGIQKILEQVYYTLKENAP